LDINGWIVFDPDQRLYAAMPQGTGIGPRPPQPASREEALSYVNQDPFAAEGVVVNAELLEWLIAGRQPGFARSRLLLVALSAACVAR
jgi:hypothetical protein